MAHTVKKFDIKGLDGISDDQIAQHRDILYAGYVKKLNEIEEKLKTVDLSTANQVFSDLRALKIEESFALNGVILHEIYFGSLGGKKGDKPSGTLMDLVERDFGSYDEWEENFKACGLAARGWAILGLSTYDGKVHNWCLDAHNSLVPFGAVPILAMDVYEHAYTIDYGVKRPPYIDAFMRNVDWKVCEKRIAGFDMKKFKKTGTG